MSSSQSKSSLNQAEALPLDQSVYSHVVAVTGTIGSGKSTVTSMLEHLGASVVSADKLARQSVAVGSEGLERVITRFGADVLTATGELDRKKIAQLVFSSPQLRQELEQITHPIIAALARKEFSRLLATKASLIVYDCPLLFEAGLDKMPFAKTVLISADQKTIIDRVSKRDQIALPEIEKRISAQMPECEKRLKADIIIENNGSLEELEQTVAKLYRELIVAIR